MGALAWKESVIALHDPLGLDGFGLSLTVQAERGIDVPQVGAVLGGTLPKVGNESCKLGTLGDKGGYDVSFSHGKVSDKVVTCWRL
jgi:hypothetical protein